MNIESTAAGYSQQKIMEEAAVKTAGMALGTMREQGQAVVELLDSAEAITDPALGGHVNQLV